MACNDFPINPVLDQIYDTGTQIFRWDGFKWVSANGSESYWTVGFTPDDIVNANTGNVGIGTLPSIDYKLHVDGEVGINSVDDTTGYGKILLRKTDGSSFAQIQARIDENILRYQVNTGVSQTWGITSFEMMRIAGDTGFVGIGTTDPKTSLDVSRTGGAAGVSLRRLDAPTNQGWWDTLAGNSSWTLRSRSDDELTAYSAIAVNRTGTLISSLVLYTDAGTERMRINGPDGYTTFSGLNSSGAAALFANGTIGMNPAVSTGATAVFNFGFLGFLSSSGKHKRNIVPVQTATDVVKQLNPVKFDWTEDVKGSDINPHDVGFIIEEIESVIPEAVKVNFGPSGEQLSPSLQDRPILAYAIKAIQELAAEVEALKATTP